VFLPQAVLEAVYPSLQDLSIKVASKQIIDWLQDAERNPPYLRGSGYNAFGHQIDALVTSQGWQRLQGFGFQEGYVSVLFLAADYGSMSYSRSAKLMFLAVL
jgi:hypothetical protein